MTDEEIAKARALCEAATPGPWTAEYGTSDRAPTINGPARPGVAGFPVPVRVASNQDAAFIAAARTLVPALLDELESARECFRQSHDEVIRLTRDADEGREFDRRNVAEIDQLTADLAATKAALVEAMTLATDAVHTLSCWVSYIPDFKNRLAALKAKVQP